MELLHTSLKQRIEILPSPWLLIRKYFITFKFAYWYLYFNVKIEEIHELQQRYEQEFETMNLPNAIVDPEFEITVV